MKRFLDRVVMIADGGADANGGPNGKPAEWILPAEPFVSVRRSYNIHKPIGRAFNFRWHDENLLADIEIVDNEETQGWFPCIAGIIEGINPRHPEQTVRKFVLTHLGLCDHNIDPRIQPLEADMPPVLRKVNTMDIEQQKQKAASMDQDCYEKAKQRGEQTFTLIARDPTSPRTICFWIMENIETAPDEKLVDALLDALAMRKHPNRRPAD